MEAAESELRYLVLVNEEEQYSIWPSGREVPAGWRDAGKEGDKEDCLAWLDEVWTDMRPLSLRRDMEADLAKQADVPDSSGN
jgi:MbtH protein